MPFFAGSQTALAILRTATATRRRSPSAATRAQRCWAARCSLQSQTLSMAMVRQTDRQTAAWFFHRCADSNDHFAKPGSGQTGRTPNNRGCCPYEQAAFCGRRPASVRKTHTSFAQAICITNEIVLPRQAREKHRETLQRR